ncbi:MAG: hypothetical protein IKZ19_05225 [Clostridia bacterium]|nr:hypothetical protein [Clostridia bacterium]
MFDKETVEAYRSIRAPESLRVKVLGDEPSAPEKKNAKIIKFPRVLGYAAAACFVFMASAWGFFGGGVEVHNADSANYGISLAREIDTCEIRVEIEQRGFCRAEVSHGLIENSSELSFFGDELILWNVSEDEAENAELKLTRYGKERIYLAFKNADSGEWEIRPAE